MPAQWAGPMALIDPILNTLRVEDMLTVASHLTDWLRIICVEITHANGTLVAALLELLFILQLVAI